MYWASKQSNTMLLTKLNKFISAIANLLLSELNLHVGVELEEEAKSQSESVVLHGASKSCLGTQLLGELFICYRR
jgi:hypothetical protein